MVKGCYGDEAFFGHRKMVDRELDHRIQFLDFYLRKFRNNTHPTLKETEKI